MSQLLPKSLLDAIEALSVLPGVGIRTAERYAYFLLRSNDNTGRQLAKSIVELKDGVKNCPKTFALINPNEDVSPLYSANDRDKTTIAVVEEPLDIVAIERTKKFKGTYHVLGGAISPIDGIGPEQLHIPELLQRIKDDNVTEVILATNASVEGESTAIFLQRQIENAKLNVTLSRLARGIPVGVDLEYADQITLSHALEGRKSLS